MVHLIEKRHDCILIFARSYPNPAISRQPSATGDFVLHSLVPCRGIAFRRACILPPIDAMYLQTTVEKDPAMPAIRVTFTILILSLLALTQSACSGTRVGTRAAEEYNSRPLKVAMPDAVDNTDAIKAAEAALLGRDWVVVSKSADQISGKLIHRRFDATVNIKIENRFLVLYTDSTYLDPQTNEITPAVPYGWLENLREDIRKFIAYENYRSS